MPRDNPSFTRGHFQFIADVISEFDWRDGLDHERFAKTMADELAHQNPRFDRDRFLDACGLGDEDEDEVD